MSRSNPTDNTPNPATVWYEWAGKDGNLKFYDKEKKENITRDLPFTFLLLDQLACVKGWSDSHGSGITSNEVRDTRSEAMTVRVFSGPTIAEGLYKDIKDKVKAAGGKFVSNLYIGFKQDGKLVLGSIQFKGAALQAWGDFKKENNNAVFTHAITITGTKDGKKGSVTFKVPTFALKEISKETNEEANLLDATLQSYLAGYLKRTKATVSPEAGEHAADKLIPPNPNQKSLAEELEDDEGSDIPF